MEIVVFGAGNIGSLIGGLLAREHAVTLVGRDPHIAAINQSGLAIQGAIEDHVQPAATTDGTELTGELAVVTVKAYDTVPAAKELATGEFETVLSLQNGLGNETELAEYLDVPILAGTTTYGATRPSPGTVRCTGHGTVTLGARDGGQSRIAPAVGEAFQTAEMTTEVVRDMPARLWEKAAINAGINPVTAMLDVPNRRLRQDPARSIAVDATREAVRVARGEGIDLAPSPTVAQLDTVIEQTADNISSMCQDLRAGGPTEIDAITGRIVRRAETHGIAVPTNDLLYRLVKACEATDHYSE